MSHDVFAPAVFPRLRDAQREAERERARRLGFAEGHAEGFRVAAAEAGLVAEAAAADRAERAGAERRLVADAVVALCTAAAALNERADELAAASESRVLAHAVELAAIVLGGELADDERSAVSAVRRALDAADGAGVQEVRLHPHAIATLQRLDVCPDDIVLTADDALAPGDAMAILEDGFIDARITAALERARRAVAEAES